MSQPTQEEFEAKAAIASAIMSLDTLKEGAKRELADIRGDSDITSRDNDYYSGNLEHREDRLQETRRTIIENGMKIYPDLAEKIEEARASGESTKQYENQILRLVSQDRDLSGGTKVGQTIAEIERTTAQSRQVLAAGYESAADPDKISRTDQPNPNENDYEILPPRPEDIKITGPGGMG